MSSTRDSIQVAIQELASQLAGVMPKVDAEAEHDRWQPGIGPFEEEEQISKLLDRIDPNLENCITRRSSIHSSESGVISSSKLAIKRSL